MVEQRVIYGDCRQVLRELLSTKLRFRLAITSPPYWGFQRREDDHPSQIGFEDSQKDYIGELIDIFSLIRELLTDDGSFFLIIGDIYINKEFQLLPSKLALSLKDRKWILRGDTIWYKSDIDYSIPSNRATNVYDHVFHLTKSKDYFYNPEEFRKWRDVWDIGTIPSPKSAWTIFPRELCLKPILACSEPGDWVLDPFCGSGAVLKVAKEMGRNALGVEINEEIYRPLLEE